MMVYRLLPLHNPTTTTLKPFSSSSSSPSAPLRQPLRPGLTSRKPSHRPLRPNILHTLNHYPKMSGAKTAPCRCSAADHHAPGKNPEFSPKTTKPNIARIFNFRHMTSLSIMVILSVSNLVSVADFAFVAFYFIYIYLLSVVAFPTQHTPPPPVFTPKTQKMIGQYAVFAGLIGLILPVAYMVWGVLAGDEAGVRAAAPHLFLLSSQLFMEGLAFYGGFSLPMFVYVPVLNNTKRIFTLVDWVRCEFSRLGLGNGLLWFGRGLAVANLALWCFNLFVFLLPVFLPRALQVHFFSAPRPKTTDDSLAD